MQFTLRCGNADVLIWIYSRQRSFECSEGGLCRGFLLDMECIIFGVTELHEVSLLKDQVVSLKWFSVRKYHFFYVNGTLKVHPGKTGFIDSCLTFRHCPMCVLCACF